jgi:aminoglycoside phosphotransferase (APT) family kinase protein
MAVANRIDAGTAERQLTAWLATKLPAGRVTDVTIPIGSGGSNETVMFTGMWTEEGVEHTERMVARVLPSGSAVFPDYNLETEFKVINAMSRTSTVPVPRVKWLELDRSVLGSPFMIMPFVSGRVLGDDPPFTVSGWLLDESPERQAELHDNALQVLVAIHAVDWRELGLDFLDRPELGRPGIDQEIAYYRDYFEWATERERNPTIENAFAWIAANTPDDGGEIVFCHGDARVGNMIFDSDRRVATVLDWETATLASPEYDLAWWLLLNRHHSEGIGAPLPAGFPSADEIVARYEELSGRQIKNIHFYEVFSAIRLSIMMVRVSHLMQELGVLPEDSAMSINNPASQILARLLDLPAPDAGETTSFFGTLQ